MFANPTLGVGKSTFTAMFASWLAYCKGKKVLVLDMEKPNKGVSFIRELDYKRWLSNPHASFGSLSDEAMRQDFLNKPFFNIERFPFYSVLYNDEKGFYTKLLPKLREIIYDYGEKDYELDSFPLGYDYILIDYPSSDLDSYTFKQLAFSCVQQVFVPTYNDSDVVTKTRKFCEDLANFKEEGKGIRYAVFAQSGITDKATPFMSLLSETESFKGMNCLRNTIARNNASSFSTLCWPTTCSFNFSGANDLFEEMLKTVNDGYKEMEVSFNERVKRVYSVYLKKRKEECEKDEKESEAQNNAFIERLVKIVKDEATKAAKTAIEKENSGSSGVI